MDLLRDALKGRYRIEREIGAGGMAVVYLARDLQRDRPVALKVLRPEVGAAAGAERFEREIRLAARLTHPNILPVLDSGAADGRLWYTMPFIDGESLRARIDREKQLPLDDAIRLTREIADALAYAHAQGVLHRDVKPENILLASGHALVTDFGIARALDETAERLTHTGITIGTPGYMSPEQSSGELHLDARSDLYSLASVSYEMLAGEPPFTGPTAQVIIARRLSQPAPSVRATRPSVPESVDSALRRALAPLPADRFATITDFERALTDSRTAAGVRRRIRDRWPVIAGVAVLLLAAMLTLRFLGNDARPEKSDFAASRAEAIRLAVMPFRLIGGDSVDQYLADGITEEIASALGNLGGLRVVDQRSVASLAASSKRLREIAEILRADALITGDVQKSGDAIRVRVRLTDATEDLKWTNRYDHTGRDVFQVQSEVATKVADVLRIQLAERESRSLSRPPTTNAAAYDAFLRARGLARAGGTGTDRAREDSDSMIVLLTQATRFDSTFAAAWATLGAELVNSVFLFDADEARLDRADTAIARAMRLDSSQAMAWKARHDLRWNAVRGWHFAEALADVRRAVELQPSLVAAHNGLGSLYFHYGFMDEARRELMASLSLDPQDGCDDPTTCQGFSRPRVARVLWYQQKFDSALAIYESMPFIGNFAWEYGIVLNGVGRPADGLAMLDSVKAAGLRESADHIAVRALLNATLRRPEAAFASIKSAIARGSSRSHSHHAAFTIACTYAVLGRRADAVEWLRRAATNGMPNYPLFRNDPNLRDLQGDPAYEALMADLARQFERNQRLVRADQGS